jgi:lysophospholipid acyltransferase
MTCTDGCPETFTILAVVMVIGPYFEVRDYLDYINRRGVWDTAAKPAMPQPYALGMLRLLKGIAYAALHLSLSKTFPVELLESQRFLSERLLVKCDESPVD